MSEETRAGTPQMAAALAELYAEGVQVGMERAADMACGYDLTPLRLTIRYEIPAAKAESREFFRDELPAPGEESDWPALVGVLAALAQEQPQQPERRKSIMRLNAERDPSYCPYCLRCTGLVRMRIVEPFLWRCRCGAVHDEREAAPLPSPSERAEPRECSGVWEADANFFNGYVIGRCTECDEMAVLPPAWVGRGHDQPTPRLADRAPSERERQGERALDLLRAWWEADKNPADRRFTDADEALAAFAKEAFDALTPVPREEVPGE